MDNPEDKLVIDKEFLKQIISNAFDEGYSGYKEIKEEVVDHLFEEILEKCEKKTYTQRNLFDTNYTTTSTWTYGQAF